MISTLATPDQSFTAPLQELIEYSDTGILSKVIVKDNNCQHTLFCLAQGTELEEHTSSRNAAINVIEGKGTLRLEGREIDLKPGVFVYMRANAPHALQALENLAFVLTLSENPQRQ